MSGVGSAISSYTAQNIGAGSEERVVKGYHAAIQMVIAFAVILCVALQLFHKPLIELFLGDEGTAAALLHRPGLPEIHRLVLLSYRFKMAADGLLRGAGDMTCLPSPTW